MAGARGIDRLATYVVNLPGNGKPDEKLGQEVLASVVAQSGANLTPRI